MIFFKNFIEERIMNKEIFSMPAKMISVFFTVFLLSLPASAGLQASELLSSSARIDYIKSVVYRYVDNKENMSDARVQNAIRNEIGKKIRLKPSRRLLNEDLKALNERARQLAAKKKTTTKSEMAQVLRKEAETLYPMYKLREHVTVRVKRGNTYYVVRGTYYRVTALNVMIGNSTILLHDLDDDTRGKFDKQFNQRQKAAFVANGLKQFERSRINKQQEIFRDLLAMQNRTNEQNGYVFIERDRRWVTAEQLVNYFIRLEEKVYLENKAREARILAEKRKQEEELARQKEAEQRRNNPDAGKTEQAAGRSDAGRSDAGGRQQDPDKKPSERRTPQGEAVDMFAGDSSAIPKDTGGNFIAMSPQDLADAMRKRPVNEHAYKQLMKRVDAQIREIGANYWGIDADQGYKKALWGFSETDVYYALSKEIEIAFLEKYTINRNDIIFPKGSRPSRIYLYYFFGKLNELRIIMGSLKEREFKIFKDSLNGKYGQSTTQIKHGKDDIFYSIQKGTLTHDRLPVVLPEAEQKKYTEKAAAQEAQAFDHMNIGKAVASAVPFVIVWEGRISRGVLTFNYDPATGIYSNVTFHKKCFPERLDADRKKRAEAAKKAAEAKKKPAAANQKAPTPKTGK